jgi:hypothetical protein
MRKVLILAALASLPLAACNKDAPAPANGNGQGEVLPGSISDAMLPEARVTSQPPLDPGQMRVKSSGAPADEATGAADAEAAAPAAEGTKAAE